MSADTFIADIAEYTASIFPLVIGHLTFPPLSYFMGEIPPNELRPLFDLWYSVLPRNFKSLEFINSMILFEDQRASGFHGTMVTSLFVHYNFNHLLSNLVGLFTAGYRVYRRSGAFSVYAIFFSGGIASSMPFTDMYQSFLQSFPISKSSSAVTKQSTSLLGQLYEMIPKDISKVQDNILSALQKATFMTKAYIGSSGAICALMGYEFASATLEIASILKSLVVESRQETRSKQLSRFHIKFYPEKMFIVFSNIWVIYTYSIAMRNDWLQIQSAQESLAASSLTQTLFFTFFGSQGSSSVVDYQCHLQGFGFGALAGLGHVVFTNYINKSQRY